ncbi:YihY/virulence factor BrkB family protein [Frankia sp. AiPs1]|uniref:YihY/virulence factor BrkB family protein n=1 Tax=Frankia sp. AiPs1 TaxID=573493 RepID=UPI002044BE5C|nr:YihY/virulence factor BrkB family protein [Frankia sp. AiPs1]MCM3923032.1 YihY/virulence factor BrkB family protein [Frankia sp. AiPs1]
MGKEAPIPVARSPARGRWSVLLRRVVLEANPELVANARERRTVAQAKVRRSAMFRRLDRQQRRVPRGPLRLARTTLANAWRHRVLGLAAEAGFWQLLSLPPLLLSLLGALGYVADAIGGNALSSIRDSILRGAGDLLTESVVDDAVRPTVDEILSRGRPDVISIGFVLSLWTGSTAMATFVNTITIAYGQRDQRSAVRSRLVALGLFLAQVTSGVIILPALILGPGLISRILDADRHPSVDHLLTLLFWPVVGLVALAMLTSLYHLSLPMRRPWWRALPGATLALVCWLVGSDVLRLYLEIVFSHELVYGSLGAPVAALLFFYITAVAVLLGAELNAALDEQSSQRKSSQDGGPTTGGTSPAGTSPAGTSPAGTSPAGVSPPTTRSPPAAGGGPPTGGGPGQVDGKPDSPGLGGVSFDHCAVDGDPTPPTSPLRRGPAQ